MNEINSVVISSSFGANKGNFIAYHAPASIRVCIVTISSIYLRILEQVDDSWIDAV